MSETNSEVIRALGRIEGRLHGIERGVDENKAELNGLRNDVSNLKVQSARSGATAGTVASIGIALIVAGARELFKSGGGNGPLA